ncbi:signal transduction histidine kinase [Actinomadura pelletieri DSM 43383]|uniref:histidine kinase n=1 Tax=Actinomadura pelletieri DSM 43383 TaxID=1120940 RepID=A0A495QG69_9ACTN|nr:sensor histidine kinase [Actinomadura pelletieri]RKS70864.1 signal transduction histidine kinase [Actinomadura pelletieri DSM 43383]
MSSTRPVPWVSPLLCLAVLVGGAYYALVDDGPSLHLAGFTALLLLLIGLDFIDRHIPAPALLLVQAALYIAVNTLDDSGISRALIVLVPFTAYFTLGPRTAIILGTGCITALPLLFSLTIPNWQTNAERVSDVVMFALGIVLAITMAAVAVREREARVRLEATLCEVEALSAAQERNRLAREIHDSLGHHLTAIAVQLEKATAFADLDPNSTQNAVASARWSANQALTEVRHSVRALGQRPFRLTDALTELIDHLNNDRLTVSLDVTGDEDGRPLTPLHALYRAAQEALTNACRHSGATNVRLSLSYENSGASLTVTDDGHGFDLREGFGLRGMRERIAALNGHLDLASTSAGTTISIQVPW